MQEQFSFPLLTMFVFAPVIGMAAILLVPSKRADIIKTVAAAAAAVPLMIGLYLFFAFRDTGALQYRENLLWIDGLNVHYALGIDGLSVPMVVLSGVVGFLAVVASWGIEKQIKGYFALILMLLSGMNGVFCALDFFLFYVFWEVMLLPMYFLIGIWGGPNRVYAAIKFFLYTMAGSVLMLVVLLATWYWSDGSYANVNNPAELAAVNAAKESVVALRAGAFDRLAMIDPDITRVPARLKRAVLAQDGVAWAGNVDRDLINAKDLKLRLDNLPPTIDGDKHKVELEKAQLLLTVKLERTFSLTELKERYLLFTGSFKLFEFLRPLPFAALMFVFLYVAFAIKVPVFPFHTWLPWAHVEAPTAISVILAGILLKMGVYGFLRISFGLFPTEAVHFAVPMAVFGVFNILYGACCAMAQDDMKKLVAYSSVSHMGFCMLGMAAMTTWGMTGSVLQMFNHGTSTSMMFLLVGVIYDRAHHREINKFGGIANQMPVYAGMMTLALFASMGLPGLSGFVSEILVFLGSFRSDMGNYSRPDLSFQSMTVIAAIGVVLTAGYLLWMMQRVFFGPLNERYKGYADMNGREMFTLVPLAVIVIGLGVYPQPLINLTKNSVEKLQQHVLRSNGIESAERTLKTMADRAAPAAPAPLAAEPAPAHVESAPAPKPAADPERTSELEPQRGVEADPVKAREVAMAGEGR
ncbi:MAG: NADH-quinone oxidoreductase subunit M [Planctomycetota bacterium]|nr:NADH-quinone oxidoreductase subunit M [Planctomycetota bacterium]